MIAVKVLSAKRPVGRAAFGVAHVRDRKATTVCCLALEVKFCPVRFHHVFVFVCLDEVIGWVVSYRQMCAEDTIGVIKG